MAFCNKLGSLVKQSGGHVSTVMPSMLNSVRCMSTNKLFIGGLAYRVDDQTLKDAFSSFGDVTEARVILDRDTGRSRGFGFVNFASDESASSAMSAMDGQELSGRNIRVSYANDRTGPPRFGNNFGGSRYDNGSGNNSGF